MRSPMKNKTENINLNHCQKHTKCEWEEKKEEKAIGQVYTSSHPEFIW